MTKTNTGTNLDVLLASDINLTEDYHIKRLGINLTFRVIVGSEVNGFQGGSYETTLNWIVTSEQTGIFRNVDLMQKFNANSPAEVIEKVLLPGEISDIVMLVQKLCGFDLGATVEEAKN